VRSLEQGAYEDFLDSEVNSAWLLLIAKTVELARNRQAGTRTFRNGAVPARRSDQGILGTAGSTALPIPRSRSHPEMVAA
jgi:hypothetical protein